jgi:mRNA interferase MazF
VGFDDVISPDDSDFIASGLRGKSLIRLGFLAVVPRNRVIGSIGSISSARHERLLTTLSNYLVSN